ncbi:luciferase family oxidoreductase, group 1 [Corynebacterium kutscheri]|uniref:Luciferase family oxidoreductase, group 1 n=1 Tax=Corynebacterium kutscheri TaxID=35755 RepID=A0A0F6QZV3_9CORY|nr:LLM class flavin-dependent oxidoreductase [Corynebacterium kutscheri]AKE40930.1 luciferase family oxidoreductase, group 1 [Corynebacterium kutscheri]VEH09229.1 monooxygenase [Corynebacterium kutscheri]
MKATPLSILDFATIFNNERPGMSFSRSVELAQRAEELDFHRIWYAEHHNMPSISSSAPALLIAHVGAHTSRIRLGAGGVMLPNHSPYTVAEQFGTLAEMYGDRIDLGLGRAPGTDQNTLGKALRRAPHAADSFPQDVIELQKYLADESIIPGVRAIPGAGTQVPLYILGSSTFGATLAAQLGLPYSFASHFAPAQLEEAVTLYRKNFQPSQTLAKPYVIAAVNVTAADTNEAAFAQRTENQRRWVRNMLVRQGQRISDTQLDHVMQTYQARQVLDMMRYTAVGTGERVWQYLTDFSHTAQADELMISLRAPSWQQTMRGLEILAHAREQD